MSSAGGGRLRSLEDVPRNRNQRIQARFAELALALEQAVAEWNDNEAAMVQFREERSASGGMA